MKKYQRAEPRYFIGALFDGVRANNQKKHIDHIGRRRLQDKQLDKVAEVPRIEYGQRQKKTRTEP